MEPKDRGSSSQCNRVLVSLDGAHRVLQILSLFLLGQHMDDGVHCLVVEVSTNASDESLDVAYVHSFGVSTPLKGFKEDVDGVNNSLSSGTTHSVLSSFSWNL